MTSTITVTQLVPQLISGGVEVGVLTINRALIDAGHRSIVISGGGPLVQAIKSAGGEHVTMQVWKKSPTTLLTVRKLRRWMRQERPDVIDAASRIPAWLAWLAWRRLPVDERPRFVTSAHGLSRINAYSKVITFGERVIAVSHTCRDHLLEGYPDIDPEKVVVVHRGVDPDEFPYGYQPSGDWVQKWFAEFPRLKNQFVACLPGRVTRLKGHLDLVQALHLLKQSGVRIHGLIAGGEDPRRRNYSEELRSRITELGLTDQVTFAGHRSDLKDVLSVSDVVVSATSTPPESFGLAVLEAVRLGKITLGYDIGGVKEVLSQVYPEGLVPPNDVKALADRLLQAKDGLLSMPSPNARFLLSDMQVGTLRAYSELYGR